MDVIGAAKKISEAGANLDKFCKLVADQVYMPTFPCILNLSVVKIVCFFSFEYISCTSISEFCVDNNLDLVLNK